MKRLAVAVLLSLSASVAQADVVEPPPTNCPPGSEGQSSHAGPICAPTAECTDDASCGAGLRCAEISQCIDTRPCGGGWAPPDCTLRHVMDVCDATTNCGGSATCTTRRICQPEPPPAAEPPPATTPPAATEPAPAESSGGSCSAGRGGSALGALLLGALALVFRARR